MSRIGRIAAANRRTSMPARIDAERVRVLLCEASGRRRDIGSGWDAIRDRRLTIAERAAVRAAVNAVALLRHRFGRQGYDDAGQAVTLVLRSHDADERGPFAEEGSITAGGHNPLVGSGMSGRGDRVLPLDVAIHELVHVVQFSQTSASGGELHPALAEGFADALSMLLTRDWSIGEGYFRRPGEIAHETIRQVGPSADGVPKRGEAIVTDYRQVAQGGVEEHAAGAVIARTFNELQRRIGWSRAEDLIWAIVNDPDAWKNGGTWKQIAASMVASAQRLWPRDASMHAAVGAAMRSTHLDEAMTA